MKKGDSNSKGFTIIEVSLVLAIAGLIFLMIFIALPALQRQQRDTARKEDITALISAVKKYQTNNRGALPGSGDTESTTTATYKEDSTAGKNTWAGFLRDYMTNGFEDPSSGESYKLVVTDCSGGSADSTCTSAEDVTGASFPNDFKIYLIKAARCSGDDSTGALRTSNPRKVAVLYKLEGGGIYCENS